MCFLKNLEPTLYVRPVKWDQRSLHESWKGHKRHFRLPLNDAYVQNTYFEGVLTASTSYG